MSDPIGLPTATMRCDTPQCGHEEAVSVREVRKYVGAQCPRCSAVMVTEETVRSAEAYLAIIDAVNAVVGPIEGPGKRAQISVLFDTEGDLSQATFKKLDADTA